MSSVRYSLYTIDSRYERNKDRIIESFTIQDQVIDLELDTGASYVSVINENTYNQFLTDPNHRNFSY